MAAAVLLLCGTLFNAYDGARSLRQMLLLDQPLLQQFGKDMVVKAAQLEATTKRDALVCVTWAGTVPYFADRKYFDFLGKNDRYIARLPMRVPPRGTDMLSMIKYFYPGHLKTDPHYTLEKVRPDVIISMLGPDMDQMKWAERYVKSRYIRGYTGFYYLAGSGRVRWDVLRASALGLEAVTPYK